MSANSQVHTVAAEILARHILPDDLRGFGFGVPVFSDADALQRCYPERTPELHAAINAAIAAEITRRGGALRQTVLALAASEAWTAPEQMRQNADRHYYRINPPGTVVTAECCLLPPAFMPRTIPHRRASPDASTGSL